MTNVFLPGDTVPLRKGPDGKSIETLGCGLEKAAKRPNEMLITQPGTLRTANSKHWMDVHARRYIPRKGDHVVGVIIASHGNAFKVDIGAADTAFIDYLSFEGATKRNRPDLKAGDLIYAVVSLDSKRLEPELTCLDREGRSRGLGALPSSGSLFQVNLNLARRLLSPSSTLLSLVGKDVRYEIACGVNGRIWVNAFYVSEVIAIRNIILGSEFVPECDLPAYVDKKISRLRGFAEEPSLADSSDSSDE